ncbi:hypothetical protein AAF712_015065, partial [Marasmius tenuissimus]
MHSDRDRVKVWYMAIECEDSLPKPADAHNLRMHLGYINALQETKILDVRRSIASHENCPFRGEIKDVYKPHSLSDDVLQEIDLHLRTILQEKPLNEFAVKVSGRRSVREALRTSYHPKPPDTLDCLILIVEPPKTHES